MSDLPNAHVVCKPLYASPRSLLQDSIESIKILNCLRLQVAATVDYGELLLEDDGSQGTLHTTDRARAQQRAASRARALIEIFRKAAALFLEHIDFENLRIGVCFII